MIRKITVHSRIGAHPGLADENVAIFDCFDVKAGRVVRHYVLLHKAAKLMYEPWDWKDRWYVDLVDIRWLDAHTLELIDLYVDVIVEGNGPTYRIIDLEELADALVAGKVSIAAMHQPLQCLQQFLDDHLHGGKDFPPALILPFGDVTIESAEKMVPNPKQVPSPD